MTVGDLKRLLKDAPDSMELYVQKPRVDMYDLPDIFDIAFLEQGKNGENSTYAFIVVKTEE